MTIPVDPVPRPYTTKLTGQLLVSTPLLTEATFHHTVIAILEHNADGAMGVVLNRETTVTVRELLPLWAEQLTEPKVLYAGGPVAGDSVIALAQLPTGGRAPMGGWRPCFDRVGLVDLDVPPPVFGPVAQMRIFAGYAGWGAGQLESEIAEGSWYVVAPEAYDFFAPVGIDHWRRVLRRQAAPMAYASTYTDTAELN